MSHSNFGASSRDDRRRTQAILLRVLQGGRRAELVSQLLDADVFSGEERDAEAWMFVEGAVASLADAESMSELLERDPAASKDSSSEDLAPALAEAYRGFQDRLDQLLAQPQDAASDNGAPLPPRSKAEQREATVESLLREIDLPRPVAEEIVRAPPPRPETLE